jgi:hypothetical protein
MRVPKHLLGRDEAQISKLTAVGISGAEGLPRATAAFFRSLAAGLEDGPQHFSRLFRSAYDCSPSALRRDAELSAA